MTTPSATPRFARVPDWLLRAEVSHGAVRLYALLDRRAGKKRKCWPRRETMRDELGVTLRTVDNYLEDLRRVHAVTWVQQRDECGDLKESLYTLHMGGATDCTTPCNGVHDGAAPGCTTGGATGCTVEGNESNLNESKGARGTPALFPDVFTVTDSMQDWAESECPTVDWRFETRQFVDFHKAHADERLSRDWVRVWKRWIRRADRTAHQRGAPLDVSPFLDGRERQQEVTAC